MDELLLRVKQYYVACYFSLVHFVKPFHSFFPNYLAYDVILTMGKYA